MDEPKTSSFDVKNQTLSLFDPAPLYTVLFNIHHEKR